MQVVLISVGNLIVLARSTMREAVLFSDSASEVLKHISPKRVGPNRLLSAIIIDAARRAAFEDHLALVQTA